MIAGPFHVISNKILDLLWTKLNRHRDWQQCGFLPCEVQNGNEFLCERNELVLTGQMNGH
jgi:hypothetical protein